MIDLRSDTVTKPTSEMRQIIANAEVGDDVYGDDPTVNQLQELAADMLGKESALFCSSGTQTNLLALMSHCERGDEYIVGQQAHTYKYEGGGAAVLGSIQPQPIEIEADGTLELNRIKSVIKDDDFHHARTRLICLENTFSGKVLPLSYLEEANKLASENNLGIHLDGARVFNAAVKLKIDVQKIAENFDSVSVCLSKNLGAPVGSVLCGSKELVSKARRWRKVLGGGMRQAGILAAAGIYALNHNIERLEEDHQNAELLATLLSEIDELNVFEGSGETNMVFFSMDDPQVDSLAQYLKSHGILINSRNPVRLVTHLDVNRSDIEQTVEKIKAFFYQ